MNNDRYPVALLNAAIVRIRSELGNVTYERASILKAYLSRVVRIRNTAKEDFLVSLDKENPYFSYQFGRLFAVMEKLQIDSGVGGDTLAGIRAKYYGAASSTPRMVFPLLDKLKSSHLKKIGGHLQIYYEKMIGEIMDRFDGRAAFPTIRSLEDQGRFAIGYYQQRQDLFKLKSDKAR